MAETLTQVERERVKQLAQAFGVTEQQAETIVRAERGETPADRVQVKG